MRSVRIKVVHWIEKTLSFGGICTLIGVVADLMTPVGHYTILVTAVGAATLATGLAMVSRRGFSYGAGRSLLLFGALLTLIGSAFFFLAPNDRGVLASQSEKLALAQDQLLGITVGVKRIAQNAERISGDVATAMHLAYTEEGFRSALATGDETNIGLYCRRGYDVGDIGDLFPPEERDRRKSDAKVSRLVALNCYDVASVCDPDNWMSMWFNLADRLDEGRVRAICGSLGVRTLEARRLALRIEKIESQRKREIKYRACLQEYPTETYGKEFQKRICEMELKQFPF